MMVHCRSCAEVIADVARFCPRCGAPQPGVESPSRPEPRTFGNSISICFRRYAVFRGRAPRAEYWWFALIGLICQFGISFVVGFVPAAIGDDASAPVLSGLAFVVELGLILPNLAVSVRRLLDLDRSGWWLLIAFVPLVGAILLLVWYCTRGTRGPNRFGEDPLPAGT